MKQANFVSHRKLLKYNDGAYVQLNDAVENNGKKGKIFSFDWLAANIDYDDGSSETNVPIENIKKIASVENEIINKIIKNSYWIN